MSQRRPQGTRMQTECTDRVKTILATLQIPLNSIASRSLVFHPEAADLVVAETADNGKEHVLVASAANAWRAMNASALADGVAIRIVSAFRTIDRQAEIVRAKMEKGLSLESILCVSAPPGYSEHHSRRAIDVTTDGVRPLEREFDQTDAFRWLSR